MVTDEFQTFPVKYRGIRYRCGAHAQWAMFFRLMGVSAEYLPLRFTYEFPGPERYNVPTEPTVHHFDPTFFVRGMGFFHIIRMEPLSFTTLSGERLSAKTDEAVYVVEGAPQVPSMGHTTNPVTVCWGHTAAKRWRRLIVDNSGDLDVKHQIYGFQLMHPSIVDAFVQAEHFGEVLRSDAVGDVRGYTRRKLDPIFSPKKLLDNPLR